MLDPQVQIRIIDLASKWIEDTRMTQPSGQTQELLIKNKAKMFDVAYKALLETVQPK